VNKKILTRIFLVISIVLSIITINAYINAPQKLEDVCFGTICLDVIPKELPEKNYAEANKILVISTILWINTVAIYVSSRRTITITNSKV